MLLTFFCFYLSVTKPLFAQEKGDISTKLTQQQIKESILGVINALEHDYLFPEKAKLIKRKLQYKLGAGEFNKTNELGPFINDLAVLIRNVSDDPYLDVVPTHPEIVINQTSIVGIQATKNFGIEKVEILPGNIGYWKLNYFYQHPNAEIQVDNTFKLLSGTDAIIIDLRDVEGDSITLAQYIMSYFVEKNTQLSSVLYDRQQNTKNLTAKNIDSERLKNNYPVYILTSAFVSGTGEFLSYTLKHLDKAVIVGEQTMGVANIVNTLKVNELISVSMPIAIPIHPITNNNWQQYGVVPDYQVDAKGSFDTAYQLAKQHLGLL